MSKENVYALHLSVLRERGQYVFNCKPNASMFLIAYHDIETIFDQYLDEAYSYGLMEYLFENLNIQDLSRIPEDEIIRLDQWRIVITSKDIVETDRNFSNQRRNLTILVGSKEQNYTNVKGFRSRIEIMPPVLPWPGVVMGDVFSESGIEAIYETCIKNYALIPDKVLAASSELNDHDLWQLTILIDAGEGVRGIVTESNEPWKSAVEITSQLDSIVFIGCSSEKSHADAMEAIGRLGKAEGSDSGRSPTIRYLENKDDISRLALESLYGVLPGNLANIKASDWLVCPHAEVLEDRQMRSAMLQTILTKTQRLILIYKIGSPTQPIRQVAHDFVLRDIGVALEDTWLEQLPSSK